MPGPDRERLMLLALDTCGLVGGVALAGSAARGLPADEGGLGEVFFHELSGRTYSEGLLDTVAAVVEEAGVTLSDLTAIVVVRGPGSFTGIRIGVSAAKGLAEALTLPVVAISRLALLADTAAGSAIALLDAGRQEYYVGAYRAGECQAEVLLTGEELPVLIEDTGLPVVVCEERPFAALERQGALLVEAPTAIDALHMGKFRLSAGLVDDLSTLEANYVRRTGDEMLARIAAHAALRATRSAEIDRQS